MKEYDDAVCVQRLASIRRFKSEGMTFHPLRARILLVGKLRPAGKGPSLISETSKANPTESAPFSKRRKSAAVSSSLPPRRSRKPRRETKGGPKPRSPVIGERRAEPAEERWHQATLTGSRVTHLSNGGCSSKAPEEFRRARNKLPLKGLNYVQRVLEVVGTTDE